MNIKRCSYCNTLNDGAHKCEHPEYLVAVLKEELEGKKYDQGKPDLSLLPRELLEETARAFEFGAKKYGRSNYKKGMDWHRVTASAMRHLVAFGNGEDMDSESGLSHLAHLGACVGMLLYYTKNKVGKDTRAVE